MSALVVLGGGIGLGVLLVVRAVRPRPVALAVAIRRVHSDHPSVRSATGRRRSRWTRPAADWFGSSLSETVERDLRVLDRTVERHVVDKLAVAISLLVVPLAGGWLLGLTAAGPGPLPLLLAALGGGIGGFVLPDLLVRSQAAERRRQFTFALSSYLDLVNVLLAGGAGVETALEATAQSGDGWAFHQLRDALLRARTMRRSPWSALGELGEQLGIDELIELAASIQLAGEEGARIRASLSARASALRSRQMARIEADANSASERLGFPTVAMFLAFLTLLAYPAIQQIAGS